MKKIFYFSIMFIFLLYSNIFGLVWQRTLGGSAYDYGQFVQQTADQGYIVAGVTDSYSAGEEDFWVIKTDWLGQEEWSNNFGGSSYDFCCYVQQTTDGGYILAGYTYSYGHGSGDGDGWLIKIDENGHEQWNHTYGGYEDDAFMTAQQTLDGGYILSGLTCSYGVSENDFWLVKTDSNGNEEWNRTYGGSDHDLGCFARQTSEGGYIFTGYTKSYGSGSNDIWLIKIDPDGYEEWNRTYDNSGRDEFGYCVQQTADQGYIIAARISKTKSNYDLWILKTDPEGNLEWDQIYNDLVWSYPSCYLDLTADGGYIIVGGKDSVETQNEDLWLLKLNQNGKLEWSRIYGGPLNDQGYAVQQLTDGGYIITGVTESYNPNDGDLWLIYYNPDLLCNIDISKCYIELSYPGGDRCRANQFQLNNTHQYCDGNMLWESSDPSVAQVNEAGLVTAMGPGAASISLACSNNPQCFDSCEIYVDECPPEGCLIDIVESNVLLSTIEGESCPPTGLLLTENHESCPGNLVWISYDNNLVRVYGGYVIAFGEGKTIVEAYCSASNSCYDQCSITVVDCLPGIELPLQPKVIIIFILYMIMLVMGYKILIKKYALYPNKNYLNSSSTEGE